MLPTVAGLLDVKLPNSEIQLNLCKTATLKKKKNDFQDKLSLHAGQKYGRLLQGEHSVILSTCIKLPFVIQIFVSVSIFSGRLRQILLYIIHRMAPVLKTIFHQCAI